jgi:hypothetical protein
LAFVFSVGGVWLQESCRCLCVRFRAQALSGSNFESILNQNTDKDISWFFKTIINSKNIIDFKFSEVTTTKDSVSFSLKNRTNVVGRAYLHG